MPRGKVPSSSPVPLHEVLEEEYAALRGALPDAYQQKKEEIISSRQEGIEDEQERNRRISEDLVAEVCKLIHALPQGQKRAALCLSGGGIRSATFGLGVLQALARFGLLDKFDYLSTVSGGGYIGSWLTAWIRRHPNGLLGVVGDITRGPVSKLEPGPAPIQYLRTYSNYLSPRLGFFSADSWTLLATILRNTILNWLLLIPLLAAVLMIPRFSLVRVAVMPESATYFILLIGFVLGMFGIAYAEFDLPTGGNRRQSQTSFLWLCLLPLVLSAVCITVFWAWYRNADQALPQWWVFLLFGMFLHLFGWLAGLIKRGSKPQFLEWAAVPVSGALGGLSLWWVGIELFSEPSNSLKLYVCFAAPLLLILFLLGTTLYLGLASHITNEEDREWWGRAGAWFLIVVSGWIMVSSLVIYGPTLVLLLPAKLRAAGGLLGVISGAISVLAGYSGKTAGSDERERKPGFMAIVERITPRLAAVIFIVILLAVIALGTTALLTIGSTWGWFDHSNVIRNAGVSRLCTVFVILLLASLALGFFIDINKFSLHSMYGNRIVRAYLGASHRERKPHPFTGFDPKDNIPMHDLREGRPLHVVNIALNLVKGDKLAWQQRKAEPFTVTRLHSGSWGLGYRESGSYSGSSGISLGKAVAISGAAASPNMGYHSSPPVTFLMTLFNARLGWWLGNPARNKFHRPGPLFAVGPMIAEAFGLTDDKSPYVYLSDGGHFENLGLYEMVLRRCHFIVVSDAGCDPDCSFEDLGNAIRKIRIDLGVPIEFEKIEIYSRKQGRKGKHCAVARIRYSSVDGQGTDGTLIYLKPAFYGNEPMDIFNYSQASPAFPHEPTTDQWFSESQFESYRMLGLYTIEQVCGAGWKGQGLEDFEKAGWDYASSVSQVDRETTEGLA